VKQGPLSQPQPALGLIIAFEAGLGVVAIVLSLLFGLSPWLDLDLGLEGWSAGLVATLPLLLGLWLFENAGSGWARDLHEFVRDKVVPLFRGVSRGGIMLVALAAGIGEELLFRGVIQAGLEGILGSWGALIIASLLFGLAHAMTRSYFIVTTIIGFYLGLLYHWTGNLLVPMLVHFLYDWVALQWYVSRYGKGG
jgi:uncharacterized protein